MDLLDHFGGVERTLLKIGCGVVGLKMEMSLQSFFFFLKKVG
jgi:hypothetical protein